MVYVSPTIWDCVVLEVLWVQDQSATYKSSKASTAMMLIPITLDDCLETLAVFVSQIPERCLTPPPLSMDDATHCSSAVWTLQDAWFLFGFQQRGYFNILCKSKHPSGGVRGPLEEPALCKEAPQVVKYAAFSTFGVFAQTLHVWD